MTVTYAYLGEITKTEKTEDGDMLVYGKATGPDLDLDEQRCDTEWLKSAMPGWAQWGNIREQHSAIAAGVGVETTEQGDDWYVKSLVVDQGTARKVEKGVLKGYSIGIKGARVVKDATAPGGRIVGGEIVEISLVDRPCNPTATMAIAKSAGGALAPVDVAGELVMDLTKAVIVDQGVVVEAGKAAPTFDRDAVIAEARTILDDKIKAPVLVKDAAGYDESADIAGAKDVIARIAALIQSEAAALATGRMEEVCDISILLDATRAMCWFLERETEQDAGDGGQVEDDLTYIGLAATLAGNDGTDSNKGAIVGSGQDVEPDSVTLVKALDASKERIKTLEADLAKAKAQPIAGGPAVTRVTAAAPQASKTDQPDAEYYRRMAETVDDTRTRMGYLQLAEKAAKDSAPVGP